MNNILLASNDLVSFSVVSVGKGVQVVDITEFEGEIDYNCNEGNLEWVKKEIVPTLPIWEGDKIFFDLIENEKRFFSLKLCYVGDTLVSHTLEF